MDKRERIQNLVGHADIHVVDQFMKGLFPKGSTLLDAGCGEGRNLQIFAGSGVRYFGLDTDQRALRMARTYLRTCDPEFEDELLQVGSLSDNHFPDSCFDSALLISVLHHCADIAEFRRELAGLKRILKPDARVLIKMETGIFGTVSDTQDPSVSFPFEESHINILKQVLAMKEVEVSYTINERHAQALLIAH